MFAMGDETGGAQYMHSSWKPSPYFLYYGTSALLSTVMPVVAAAKVSLLLASMGLAFGSAWLAQTFGRDPRLGVFGPLALFGLPLGWGFSSFVFSMPFLLFSAAAYEELLRSLADREGPPRTRKRLVVAALFLTLTYLAHVLVFVGTCWVLLVRSFVFFLVGSPSHRVAFLRVLRAGALTALPALVLSIVCILMIRSSGTRDTETTPVEAGGRFFEFSPLLDRWRFLWDHLIHRGPGDHVLAMKILGVLLLGMFLLSFRHRFRGERARWGWTGFALGITTLYLFGPNAFERPFAVWLFYSRFGTLFALGIILGLQLSLRGVRAPLVIFSVLAVAAFDAGEQREHVVRMNVYANQYNDVRELVPKRHASSA
ncbi:MAG: hypothetical protein HC923_07615 [Myxococcales bacterium]|nr:hypothetical protein [Myxococcales bacterium]